MFRRLFLDHPQSVGESYGQHAGFAFGVGLRMIGAGLACMLHGLLPFLFVKTGSKCIIELNECLQVRTLDPPRTTQALSPVPGSRA